MGGHWLKVVRSVAGGEVPEVEVAPALAEVLLHSVSAGECLLLVRRCWPHQRLCDLALTKSSRLPLALSVERLRVPQFSLTEAGSRDLSLQERDS